MSFFTLKSHSQHKTKTSELCNKIQVQSLVANDLLTVTPNVPFFSDILYSKAILFQGQTKVSHKFI